VTIASLEELEGPHVLTGIDCGPATVIFYDEEKEVYCCTFEISGGTFSIWENPDDGYRSHHDGPDKLSRRPKNVFGGVSVLCKHLDRYGDYGSPCDILLVKNAETGAMILEVGTRDIEDYYPSFVCNFSAEAIGVVSTKPVKKGRVKKVSSKMPSEFGSW